MRERDAIFYLVLAGLALGVLAIVRPPPRTIVIPDNEPLQAKLLGVWKGNGQ